VAQVKTDRTKLDALVKRVAAMRGLSIEFGIPSPAPPHLGKPGRPAPPGLTTARVLAWIEYGPPPRATPPKPAGRRSGKTKGLFARGLGKLRRLGRALLGKLLAGFRSKGRPPRAAPAVKPQEPDRARPILRWVAEARREDMRALMRRAGRDLMEGHDPGSTIELLRASLAEWTRNRLIDVGAVDTGQTRDAITAVVRRG
jgi:hypothetical protein